MNRKPSSFYDDGSLYVLVLPKLAMDAQKGCSDFELVHLTYTPLGHDS